jgi:hydrogenase maturation protease
MSGNEEKSKLLIVGLGNEFRSDDGVGLYVSRSIKQHNLKGVSVINGASDGTSLVDYWTERKHAILIDAVSSGCHAGYLYSFDGLLDEIPEDIFTCFSTHSFSISEAIRLGQALGQLPGTLTIYGIEGKSFQPGEKLSEPVKMTADRLVNEITKNIEAFDYA